MLPTLNYNVYIYIMSFLRVLLAETSSDMLTAEALGNALPILACTAHSEMLTSCPQLLFLRMLSQSDANRR